MKYKLLFLTFVVVSFASCQTLKPYERVYVNDPQMQMGNSAPKNFENYVHTIREGAVPAGSSKASGGCGCN
jgi:hypothetical protein